MNYIGSVSSDAPEQAAKWTSTISNAQQRNNAIENLARQWLNVDRAAATAWLAQSGLSPDRQQALLKTK